MAYQKCPVCDGTGIKPGTHAHDCKTCAGFGIINELTGLPAQQRIIPKTNTDTGDFRGGPMESQQEYSGKS